MVPPAPASPTAPPLRLAFHALTPERWGDFEALFGARGACGGCWCMWWRLPRSEFARMKGAPNRAAMRDLVHAGPPPGLLAYLADAEGNATGTPIGWCAVAPRETYPVLERSRVLKRIDDTPVWSVTCLFVARPFRRRGVSVALLCAAVQFAADRGAAVVEGYPVEPKSGAMPDAFAWTGLPSAFAAAGFVEVARRSAGRPIVRREVVAGRRGGRRGRGAS